GPHVRRAARVQRDRAAGYEASREGDLVAPVVRTMLRAAAAPTRAWDRFFFGEIDARRLAALRIAVGILAFATFLELAPEVEFFHSDAGWAPVSRLLWERGAQGFTLLHAITSPFGVKAFLALAMGAALAMAFGLYARAAAWATFVALVSFQQRNVAIVYGGDV